MDYESMEVLLAMKQTKYKRTFEYLHNMLEKVQGDMTKAMELSLSVMCDTVHAEAGTLWFYSKYGDGMIHPRAQFGGSPLGDIYLAPGEGIAGQVIESGEAVLISDCRKDPRWAGRVDEKTGFITKSMLCVPLISENYNFGCIQLINKTDNTLFDDKDKELAQAIATEISKDFISMNLISDGRMESDVAVMFADICGYSAMASKLEPFAAAEIVNRFLAHVTGVVNQHEGTPNKYLKDCILSYWIGTDAAKKACEAADDMINNSEEFRQAIKDKFGKKISFRVGICYGPAFVGNIGSSVLADHTVFGHTVNVASFLENNAPADKIYVSESVVDVLGGAVSFKRISPFSIYHHKTFAKAYLMETK